MVENLYASQFTFCYRKSLRKRKHRWDDIEVDIKEILYENLDSIQLAQVMV
jgi:hypothetical protein